jgi:site-specific DNA recombinase
VIAAIYARKSTEQNVPDEEKSVTRQIENARAFATAKGWTVLDEFIYSDDGISGAEFEKRPALTKLRSVIGRRAPFQVVVVSEQKTLGREIFETGYIIKQLLEAGVELWGYLEKRCLTPRTAIEKVTSSIQGFADENHREMTSARVHETMTRKHERGHVTGGRVFGYHNRDVCIGVDQHGRPQRSHVVREVVESEAAVVRKIFQLAADGLGKTAIALRLNREGAPAPYPGIDHRTDLPRPRGWSGSSVREVLHRTLYVGIAYWNKTRKRNSSGKTKSSPRSEAEWKRTDVPELRIVSDDVWRAAHAQLEAHRQLYLRGTKGQLCGHPRDGVDRKYLLTGLSRCALCGGTLEVRSRRHGRKRVQFYMCATARRRGVSICRGLAVPMQRADDQVLGLFDKVLLDPARLDRVCRRVVDHFGRPEQSPAARRPELLKRRTALEGEIARFVDAIAAAGEQLEPVVAAIKTRNAERAEIDRELEALANSGPVITLDVVKRTLDALVREWRTVLVEDQKSVALTRQVVQKLIDSPFVFEPETRDEVPGFRVRVRGTLRRPLAMALKVDEAAVAQAGDSPVTGRAEESLEKSAGAHAGTSPTGFEPVFWP